MERKEPVLQRTVELEQVLRREGAELVGCCRLPAELQMPWSYGVSVAVGLPAHIVRLLQHGPNKEYYYLYRELNARLDRIVTAGARYLAEQGFAAQPQTTDAVRFLDKYQTELPHKTVAVQAGLGWIGKNCLLVTPEFGSAVRLSSLLTNAPLQTGQPSKESRCGACRLCVESCPGKALRGVLWQPGMERDRLVDKVRCMETQTAVMKAQTGIETDLCGKCFAVCPYTQGYLRRAEEKDLPQA